MKRKAWIGAAALAVAAAGVGVAAAQPARLHGEVRNPVAACKAGTEVLAWADDDRLPCNPDGSNRLSLWGTSPASCADMGGTWRMTAQEGPICEGVDF